MKKVLFALVAIVLLSTSCLNAPTGGSTTGTKYDATQDAKIASLEGIILGPNGLQAIVGNIQGKISGISDIPSLITRVTALDARVTSVEGRVGTPTGGGVTQAQIDALSARIKTLEDWKAGLPTGGGGTVNPSEPGIVAVHGNLQLILERAVEDEVWMDDNVSQTWRLTVRNTGTTSTYFRINAYFDAEQAVDIDSVTLTPDFSGTSGIKTDPTTYAGSYASLPFLITSTGTSNKLYIGKSRDESLYLTLKIDYTGATAGKRWTWDFSIRDLGG